MHWYLTKIVFRIVCGDGHHQAQFDEQFRLIAAHHDQEAFAKAQQLGRACQERFLNHQQQWVEWQFINVSELIQLEKLEDAMELYYQITEPESADHYIRKVHLKAQDIISQLSEPV